MTCLKSLSLAYGAPFVKKPRNIKFCITFHLILIELLQVLKLLQFLLNCCNLFKLLQFVLNCCNFIKLQKVPKSLFNFHGNMIIKTVGVAVLFCYRAKYHVGVVLGRYGTCCTLFSFTEIF